VLTETVPVDQIRAKAESIDPARVALALAAIPFLVIGWIARSLWRVVWAVVSFAFAAVQYGWAQAARSPAAEPEPEPEGGP